VHVTEGILVDYALTMRVFTEFGQELVVMNSFNMNISCGIIPLLVGG